MKHWDVWQRMQTVHAYGAHHSADSPFSDQQRQIAGAWLGSQPSPTSILAIGPGGPVEMRWLRSVLPVAEIVGLTAHEPERTAIMADGYTCAMGDVHETPFQSERFEAVFANNVLEHLHASYVALMEIRRIVRIGGTGYFIVPSFEGDEGGVGPFHIACHSVEEWQELLNKTGWRLLERFDQPADHTTRCYHHFRCEAEPPRGVHAIVFREICEAHA